MSKLSSSPLRSLIPALVVAAASLGVAGQAAAQAAPKIMCGGIGVDESTAMRASMKDHPLALLFARTDGAYAADVDVTVKTAAGKEVLTHRAEGPVCLVDLPAGRYSVAAKSEGASKQQKVTVGKGSKTLDFRF